MRAALLPDIEETHAVRFERLFRDRFRVALAPDERPWRRAIDCVARRAVRHARPVVVELECARVSLEAVRIGTQRQHRHRRHIRLVEAQFVRHVQGRQCGLRQHLGQHLFGLLAGDAHRPVPAEVRGPPETAGRLERRHRRTGFITCVWRPRTSARRGYETASGYQVPAAEDHHRLVQSETCCLSHESAGQHVGRVGRLRVWHDLQTERPRPRIPVELVERARLVRRVQERATRVTQGREHRLVEGCRDGQRLVSVSERPAARKSLAGPRLAIEAGTLIPAVVRALRGGGEQRRQVAVGLVGDARHVGRRKLERLRGRPAAIDHHRTLGRLDGLFLVLLRRDFRRSLSRGGMHHEHPAGFRGGRVEDEDQLRVGRRDGPQLAWGRAGEGRARHELLPQFREPVHRRLRRLRDRVGFLARRARRNSGRRAAGHPSAARACQLLQKRRAFAGIDHVRIVESANVLAVEVDQRIAVEPRSVPTRVLLDGDRNGPDVLAGAAVDEVRATARDGDGVGFARQAGEVHVGPLDLVGDLRVGPLEADDASLPDIRVAALADVRRNVTCNRGGETRRRAGHNPT